MSLDASLMAYMLVPSPVIGMTTITSNAGMLNMMIMMRKILICLNYVKLLKCLPFILTKHQFGASTPPSSSSPYSTTQAEGYSPQEGVFDN